MNRNSTALLPAILLSLALVSACSQRSSSSQPEDDVPGRTDMAGDLVGELNVDDGKADFGQDVTGDVGKETADGIGDDSAGLDSTDTQEPADGTLPDAEDALDDDKPEEVVPDGTCTPSNAAVRCGSAELCVDGYCCDTTCEGTCMACNLPGLEGTCTNIPSGQDPAQECNDGKFCTQIDTCNGSGGCANLGDPCEGGDACNSVCHELGGGTGNCLAPALTVCGDAASECMLPSTCDGVGNCLTNQQTNGVRCTECAQAPCSCHAGECGPCTAFAALNRFTTQRSVEGWTLTGGWGLYVEVPQTYNAGPIRFSSQALGSDGNRKFPYPGSELEFSQATSPVGILPATIEFLSWHQDEGLGVDRKRIFIQLESTGTEVVLADCAYEALFPFCQFREAASADAWEPVSLTVPADYVGQAARLYFEYNTNDPCCAFERGWYIDDLNFGGECACVQDQDCEASSGTCGASICGPDAACDLVPEPAGSTCGDSLDSECNAADSCDGHGYCAANQAANGLTFCNDCPAGAGSCSTCQQGVCPNCIQLSLVQDFTQGALGAGWLIEDLNPPAGADWGLFMSAPASQVAGSTPTAFSGGPVLGTDGNRKSPYPGLETEHSRITTPLDTVPIGISFLSWHVDEGSTDNKRIELSVDNGQTWNVLVDCLDGIQSTLPFCQEREDPRTGSEWDSIYLDTSAFAGQVGRLRFTHNTQDACCNFERGWFIDNLGFAQYCKDPTFP